MKRVISECMQPSPLTVHANDTLAAARDLMRRGNCRHLPVLRDGRLAGILSARDLQLIAALGNLELDRLVVADAMFGKPYEARPDTPLDEVLAEMEAKKFGAAVVTDRGRVVGIFTASDAVRLLRAWSARSESMSSPSEGSVDDHVRQLELVVDQLRRRLDGLEETVDGIEKEIRQINESEEIGVTQ